MSEQPHAALWAELDRLLRADDVRVVHLMHADLFGRARAKRFPAAVVGDLVDGVAYSKTSLVETLDGEMVPGERFPAEHGHPDLHAMADPATARVVPWQRDSAWVVCDLVEHGSPATLCSRDTLRRTTAELAAHGLEAIVAAELEFYLLRESASVVERYPRASRASSYATGVGVDPGGVLDTIHRSVAELDLGVGAATSEYSPGQFEINLRHGAALDAADRAFLLKEATKVLAHREGLQATFMAKPFADAEGSSMHLHLSLWRDGGNAFATVDGALSPLCRSFVAGVVAHAPALTALASPTVNSYKRLQDGGIVATQTSWAHDSRLAYVRVPPERGAATRIELRAGDASANPYLLIAGALTAGLEGIERELEPEAPPRRLPATLDRALDELERDDVLVAALGAELVETYVAVKRLESARFARAVTDWEWEQYAHHA